MSPRPEMVRDLAKHLSDDLMAVIARHARVMQAGGASTVEASAAIMCSAEQVAAKAIGVIVIGADASRKREAFIDTVDHLHRSLMRKEDELLVATARAEAAGRGSAA